MKADGYDFDKRYTVQKEDGWNKRNWKLENCAKCIPYLKSYGGKFFKLVILKSDFNYSTRSQNAKGSMNEQKLLCNIIRAKSRIFELSICNEWDWFITLTLDKEKYDRKNLKQYIKDLAQFIRDERKKNGVDFKYILVPEEHKDGSWHMHGMLKGIVERDMPRFVEGDNVPRKLIDGMYNNWLPYAKKFGYVSLMPMYDGDTGLVKLSSYMRKYMTKTLMDTKMELGLHSFYASQGLNGADELQGISKFNLNDYPYCYESDFVDVANLTVEQAQELLKNNQDIEEVI